MKCCLYYPYCLFAICNLKKVVEEEVVVRLTVTTALQWGLLLWLRKYAVWDTAKMWSMYTLDTFGSIENVHRLTSTLCWQVQARGMQDKQREICQKYAVGQCFKITFILAHVWDEICCYKRNKLISINFLCINLINRLGPTDNKSNFKRFMCNITNRNKTEPSWVSLAEWVEHTAGCMLRVPRWTLCDFLFYHCSVIRLFIWKVRAHSSLSSVIPLHLPAEPQTWRRMKALSERERYTLCFPIFFFH